MDWIQVVVLALVQGLTEFLPISSSAHLILGPKLLGWPVQSLAFDVAVHVGTLTAVMAYFRHEILLMLRDWFLSLTGKEHTVNSMLAWGVIVGTIPVGLFGLAIKDFIESGMRSDLGPIIIATTTVIFGLLLWLADARGIRQRGEAQMGFRDFILIGCAQAMALIPGTSRSGITITAALLLGLTRQAAARFSFLLSIPAILLPGMLKTVELLQGEQQTHLENGDPIAVAGWGDILLGVVLSALAAYACIHFFLKLLELIGMFPFVVYRMFLGVFLFIMFAATCIGCLLLP